MVKNKIELLAPAGSFDSLKGAVHAGADAVYMGGALFSARAYAENPDDTGLLKSVEYCHFYGRKLYLAVNTLLKPDEIHTQLYDFVSKAYEAGIDAVIVQDLGVMRFIENNFRGLPIHVSTQASVMTASGAEYLRSQIPSVTRVVPARELSLEELKQFRKETDLEMEVFVHGALCVCYSGMCLMSSYIGDRSGNRGRCAQPCRKLYESGGFGKSVEGYLLSPKDQCLIDNIPELIEAGIDSFKIEGRMKSPEYTAGTVAVYRRKIDEVTGSHGGYLKNDSFDACRKNGTSCADEKNDNIFSRVNADDKQILMELYNRGGFNNGYLRKHNGNDMMSMKRPNHSGVPVGKVERVNGREAVIRLTANVYSHDVLEIRRADETKVFEFTTAETAGHGTVIKTITMKDPRANVGDEVYRTRCNELLRTISETFLETDLKIPVNIRFEAHKGQRIRLSFIASADTGNLSVDVFGDEPEPAEKSPATDESIKKQLLKLGETRFTAISADIDIDNDLFIPVSLLNSMRREATEKLEQKIIESNRPDRGSLKINEKQNDSIDSGCLYDLEITEKPAITVFPQGIRSETEHDCNDNGINNVFPIGKLYASCWNTEQLKAAYECRITEVCLNISDLDIRKAEEAVDIARNPERIIIGLPYVSRNKLLDELADYIGSLNEKYPSIRFMVRNYDEIGMISRRFPEIITSGRLETDYMPYYMNELAAVEGSSRITLSSELEYSEIEMFLKAQYLGNADRLRKRGLIIYGYQPSMISAQCVYRNVTGKCKKDIKGRNADNRKVSLVHSEKADNGQVSLKHPEKADNSQISSEYPENAIVLNYQGNSFITRQLCEFCTNIIYNSACLNNTDKAGELLRLGIDYFRLDFTYENEEEIRAVINAATQGTELAGNRYTRGHLFRKVQ